MITKRQKQVLEFINSFKKKKGFSPSLEEIKKHLKLSSVSTAHHHVKNLQDKGFLSKEENQPRAINVFKKEKLAKIPLVGKIAAGQPIEAIADRDENIAVPLSKISHNHKYFALQVVGQSMIDENINDGDIVLVKQQETANNGDKVVALIDNYGATLKTFYKEKNQIRLQPANKNIESIIIKKGEHEIAIQGIVIDVIQGEGAPSNNINDRTNNAKIEPQEPVFKRKLINNLNDLNAQEWIQETISVFVQKGLGLGHEDTKIERQHPAPFSFQDVGRLIKFFTKNGQRVLDPFSGVGSTLKACAINNREGIGIEIVKKYVDLTHERLRKELRDDLFGNINKNQKVICGDALKAIDDIPDNHFDFIVTSPPYWNILNKVDHKVKQERIAHNLDIKYSNLTKDIGNITNYDEFLSVLSGFFNECARVLKPKKYLCIVVSDFRHKDKFYTFHSDLAQKLEAGYYALKGITVLYQRHKKIFPYGYPYSYVPNIHHQYILILQNKKFDTANNNEKK